jgi:hypothetical protein
MKNINLIKAKYLGKGVTADNLEYAIEAVIDGSKREHIIENLTADYRGMQAGEANQLLEELFVANGGEFKKENRGGYLFGIVFLLVGLAASFYIYFVNDYLGKSRLFYLIWALAIGGLVGGAIYIGMAVRGKYRDSHDPFND